MNGDGEELDEEFLKDMAELMSSKSSDPVKIDRLREIIISDYARRSISLENYEIIMRDYAKSIK